MVVAGAAVNDATVPVNADTLGGRPANDYVTDEEVVYYSGDIAIDETVPLNADTLQGYKASDFATTDWVKGEIANAQLGGGSGEGEIDLSGFALKTDVTAEITNKISNIDFPVDSVNGKTGAVQLSAADVGALSIDGGTINGSVNMNGTVTIKGNISYSDGDFNMNSRKIWNLPTPSGLGDATNKGYVDDGLNTKAPAGFGLGKENPEKTISTVADLNNAKAAGWYRYACPNTTLNNITFNYGVLFVSPIQSSDDGCHQELIIMGTGIILCRDLYDGTWYNWKVKNPPMVFGTEYLTTERFNGKEVYSKLVNFGTMPNKINKYTSPGTLPAGAKNVQFYGFAYEASSGEYFALNYPGVKCWVNTKPEAMYIGMNTDADWTSCTAYFIVKYTKD